MKVKDRGIVLAKSMEAKKYGISTAETIYMARKKCPGIKVYDGLKYSKYREYSDKLYNLLLQYTDVIERYSIDECFLDMTYFLQKDSLLDKAYEINKRVKREFGFTVNIGVAHNKLLAKMASDFTKPDRVHTLYEDEIESKMWGLPVSELFMLGRKTVPKLYSMGIKTIGDLAKSDERILIKKFGKHGRMMWEYSNGIDNSEVQSKKRKPKSIGNSVTLPNDVIDISKLEEVLLALTEQVTYRLRKENLLANVVNVQLRTKDFEDVSHQKKLDGATSSTKEIYFVAKQLLKETLKERKFIRLIGVRVDNLVPKDELQLSLFDNKNREKQNNLDNVIDKLKDKYGYDFIKRAGEMNVSQMIDKK